MGLTRRACRGDGGDVIPVWQARLLQRHHKHEEVVAREHPIERKHAAYKVDCRQPRRRKSVVQGRQGPSTKQWSCMPHSMVFNERIGERSASIECEEAYE